jgi:hypothetical protein
MIKQISEHPPPTSNLTLTQIILQQMMVLKLQILPCSIPREWKSKTKTSTPKTLHIPLLPRGDGNCLARVLEKVIQTSQIQRGGVESEVMEHGQRNGPPLRVPHVHAGTIHQDVVLMETNKHLKEKLTLSEFYK